MSSKGEAVAEEGTPVPAARPLDFLVIGAAKTGTTTLHYHLRSHPRIFLPAAKEVPFFTRDDRFEAGWERYVAEFFADAPSDALWGKVTPSYSDHPRAAARIHGCMPRVKLVALLRDPVERCLSHYRMTIRGGQETRPFADVVAEQLDDTALRSARNGQPPSIVVQGEYGRVLGTFVDLFPRDQLLVQFTDDLAQEPQGVIDSILDFVGLAPGWTPDDLGRRYFVGGDRPRLRRLVPTAARVPPLRALWRRLPQDRRLAFSAWFSRQFNVRPGEPAPVPADVRARLTEFYQADTERLEAIIGGPVPWADCGRSSD